MARFSLKQAHFDPLMLVPELRRKQHSSFRDGHLSHKSPRRRRHNSFLPFLLYPHLQATASRPQPFPPASLHVNEGMLAFGLKIVWFTLSLTGMSLDPHTFVPFLCMNRPSEQHRCNSCVRTFG